MRLGRKQHQAMPNGIFHIRLQLQGRNFYLLPVGIGVGLPLVFKSLLKPELFPFHALFGVDLVYVVANPDLKFDGEVSFSRPISASPLLAPHLPSGHNRQPGFFIFSHLNSPYAAAIASSYSGRVEWHSSIQTGISRFYE